MSERNAGRRSGPDREPAEVPRLDLSVDFPEPDLAAWRREAERLLAGAPFDRKLRTATPEGFTLEPLYTESDRAPLDFARSLPGEPPYVRGAHLLGYHLDPWEVAQELPFPDPAEYGRALRQDLKNGQTAAVLVLDAAGRAGLDPDQADVSLAGRSGTSLSAREDLEAAFSGIDLENTTVLLHAGAAALPAAALFFAHLRRSGADLARVRGSFGTDPLADALAGATLPLEAAYDRLAALTAWLEAQTRPGDYRARSLVAWGARWHEAGANAAQELAYTLGSAVQTLREMEARGLSPEIAATRLLFGFAVGPRFLVELAKLRAARMLWARVCEACGFENPPASMWIHARTGARHLSALDPHTNLLRATTESLSAVLGGCDSLTVLPYDAPLGLPSPRARRLARNTQLILRDESRFDLVIDAAGGAHAVEALTDRLAEQAWTVFRRIEEQGGMRRFLESGEPQTQAAEAQARARRAVATRREVIVGANQYPGPSVPEPDPGDEQRAERRPQPAATPRPARGRADDALEELRRAGRSRVSAGPDAPAAAALFEAAVQAAERGGTLGELASALEAAPPQPAPGGNGGSRRTAGQSATQRSNVPVLPALQTGRLATDFEELRTRARALRGGTKAGSARTGTAPAAGRPGSPQVWLLRIGPPAEYQPRLEFTRAFFALAALDVAEGEGFDAPAEGIEAARRSGAPIVAIVSTDDRYPASVPEIARSLKAAGPPALLLAGLPADESVVAAYRAAGVDEFLHLRCDAPSILSALLDALAARAAESKGGRP